MSCIIATADWVNLISEIKCVFGFSRHGIAQNMKR